MAGRSRKAAVGAMLLVLACAGGAASEPERGVVHLVGWTNAAGGTIAPERRTFRSCGMEGFGVAGGAEATVRVALPSDAKLLFSTAPAGPDGPVAAEVRIRADGGEESVWRGDVPRPARWTPARVDLSRFAGKDVELVLRAEADPADTVWVGSPVVAGPADGRRDVVLTLIDTLREDLLEPFGCPAPSSPRIGALSRQGTIFSECTSTTSWTRPAVVSVMTSLTAATHGVIEERLSLPADVVTLADVLRSAGWYTVAFQTNPNAGRPAGLDQGFDYVVEMNALMEHVTRNRDRWKGRTMFSSGTSSGTTEMILFQLEDLLPDWDGLPLFLYLHLNDPHAPYDPREPFDRLPGFGKEGAPQRVNKPLTAYGRDVRAADWFFGGILDRLEEDGRLRRAIVTLVADHGEEFHDHGRAGHGVNLYPETLRVPLLIRAPGSVPAGLVRRDRVTVTDVLPTILDLVGLAPPDGAEGRSLLPLLGDGGSGGERFPEDPVFSQVITMSLRTDPEVCDDPAVLGTLAVIAGPWKCIVSDYGSHRDKTSVRLYDLRTDPGEQDDVAAAHPELAARLEEQVRTWWTHGRRIAGGPGAEAAEVDPELTEQLRALGYIK